jgi:uncharacterized protein DUF4339
VEWRAPVAEDALESLKLYIVEFVESLEYCRLQWENSRASRLGPAKRTGTGNHGKARSGDGLGGELAGLYRTGRARPNRGFGKTTCEFDLSGKAVRVLIPSPNRSRSLMADEWYYWHDAEIMGPFSGKLLVGLAAAGTILPTDIVWKNGIERGMVAGQVKHLFPAPPESGQSAAATPAEPPRVETTASPAAAKPDGEMPQSWFSGAATAVTARRAVAGKGATIVGQNGTTVKYRMKCTTCGHEDSSYRSVPITRGTKRVSFFCPKCRRSCAVEIHGHVT